MRGVFVTAKWTKFFSSELFSANDTKPAAYAPEKGPMSGAVYIDKRGREPGSGLTPDKKEARVDRGSALSQLQHASCGCAAAIYTVTETRQACCCADCSSAKALQDAQRH